MFTVKIFNEDAKVVVVTPLLPNHKVSKETKKTLKRNKVLFTWIHSIGDNNIPTNVQFGLDYYVEKMKGKAKYVLPLDRDIILGRGQLDKMVKTLDKSSLMSNKKIAYTYCSFEFKGVVNMAFEARPFDPIALCKNNYISSNSMIKIEDLDYIGGFVTEDKYKRLLDWCLWLQFFYKGFQGVPTPNTSFVAISTEDDVSAGSDYEYRLKKKNVFEDFVKPIIEKYKHEEEEKEKIVSLDSKEVLTLM